MGRISARGRSLELASVRLFERHRAILLGEEGVEYEGGICLTKVERGIEILVSLVGYREGIYTGVVCYPKYIRSVARFEGILLFFSDG